MISEWVGLGIGVGIGVMTAINNRQSRTIHKLVNDRSTKQDKRIDQLTTTIINADIRVPKKRNGENDT